MSISAVLGTVIGLVFVFALAALFCSAIMESISNILQKRARYLLTGLRSMLDEEPSKLSVAATEPGAPSGDDLHDMTRGMAPTKQEGDRRPQDSLARIKQTISTTGGDKCARPGDLTNALFAHPLISSLQTQRVLPLHPSWLKPSTWLRLHVIRDPKRTLRNPQYLPSKIFAQALIDTLLPNIERGSRNRSILKQIENAVDELPTTFPGRESIKTLLIQAGGNLGTFQQNLEDWYDAQMGRISGWYKRWAKFILGIVGLVLAIVVNVDAVRIAHTLYVDEPVRQAVVAQATADTACADEPDPAEKRQCVENLAASLDESGLPLWYPAGCSLSDLSHCWKWADDDRPDGRMFLVKLAGWLLVAFAVSFGAPFWFDALSKLGSLRTSGPRPNANSSGSG